MPTIEEIRDEWKGIRSSLGNLICYIDGKQESLQDLEHSWQKGYDCGHQDGLKQGMSESEDLYQRGLDDAWDVARRIISMDGHERAKAFFANCETATHAEPFLYAAQDALQMLKQYDDIMHRVTHSNAQKFVEVFGFAPGYEILEDGREVYPSLNDEFWNAEYKPPEEEENA